VNSQSPRWQTRTRASRSTDSFVMPSARIARAPIHHRRCTKPASSYSSQRELEPRDACQLVYADTGPWCHRTRPTRRHVRCALDPLGARRAGPRNSWPLPPPADFVKSCGNHASLAHGAEKQRSSAAYVDRTARKCLRAYQSNTLQQIPWPYGESCPMMRVHQAR